ncbi:MAG: diadenylate cyclase CdaA [Lentilactobacillus diolivorans]|jgi:diadenylate cyclase|uniref:Diadenylate cyclase n=2 Tax=Lentilactobacillus diolivorans TaxID=179838 RepID=A0A0R1SD25_9LACO|nr:diadenylate cyclase CdaA [Lentilactobacillus diolivorans]KRL64490.1 TIGR00159 family protein [Lentilactobacillus diolivorans DSM 14421]MDH5107093.1 diadenylate cyclase CdaA [Lentilactobacillus diolivorans]RRG00604.1 MAG: TIGR00159 family protein [Lactobacillus sp.]GEP25183.1 membrane protein [Lentilactobacillus diolivorans]
MNWSGIFTLHNLTSLIDICVVWFLIYKLILMVRGTKAVQLLRGIVIIFIIKIASSLLGLSTVSWIVDQVINWGVIAIIVIFQPEIRRGLERVGRGSLFVRGRKENEAAKKLISSLDRAIQYMSKRRIGALITIQMNTGLEEYIETGIDVDADVSGELLINIFIPNTPLHDGAVIIKNNRIAVAAAYLPLSQSNLIPKELGTRHRAAVGISELTDALTVVISEETGEVSITQNNELLRGMTQDDYLKYFRDQLLTSDDQQNHNSLISTISRFIDDHFKGGH